MRKIDVYEVVSPGFGSKTIEGKVWAVQDADTLDSTLSNLPEPLPGNILAVPILGLTDWWRNIENIQQFDAVISETGGALHHAAILMREIHAVCFSVIDLFEQVKDGDNVLIKVEPATLTDTVRLLSAHIRYGRRFPSPKVPRDAKVEFFVIED